MSLLTHSRLYLQRLGYDSPPAPTLHTLRELQLRHVCTFAFENLSSLMRLPVPIDLASVEQKVLLAGRGGFKQMLPCCTTTAAGTQAGGGLGVLLVLPPCKLLQGAWRLYRCWWRMAGCVAVLTGGWLARRCQAQPKARQVSRTRCCWAVYFRLSLPV